MAWKFFTAGGAEKRAPSSVVTPNVQVFNTTDNAAFPSGAVTAIAFDSERYKSDAGMHSTSSNTSRLVCTVAGIYSLKGTFAFSGNAVGVRDIYVYKNGSIPVARAGVSAITANTQTMVIAADVSLAVGDYVELMGFQNSGGTLTLYGQASAPSYSPQFSMVKTDGAVVSYVGVPGSLVGQELSYDQIVASVGGITGVNVAAATSIITSSSVTYDGNTPVWVEFFAPNAGVTTAGFRISFELFQDTTDIGQVGVVIPSSTTNVTPPLLRRRVTPVAGAHTFTVKAFSPDGGTGVVGAGAGGAATFVPAFIRVTRAA